MFSLLIFFSRITWKLLKYSFVFLKAASVIFGFLLCLFVLQLLLAFQALGRQNPICLITGDPVLRPLGGKETY